MKVVTAKLDTHKAIKVKREKKKMNMNRILIKFHKKVMHQSTPAAPSPPPPSTPQACGAFARLFSPGGEAFAKFALPGGWAFANPGVIPELLTRARFPIRIELHRGYYWKKGDWLICQGQVVVKTCPRF